MTARGLLDTLDGLGVSAALTPAGTLRLEPASLIPAELLAELREHRAELLAELNELQTHGKPDKVPRHLERWPNLAPFLPENQVVLRPLPEHLSRMVHAAASGQLHQVSKLSSGLVTDLGEHVLAWAATYATGSDPRHALTRLEDAYNTWRNA